MLLGFTRTLPNAARLRSTSQPPPFCDTATFARTRQTRAQLQQDRRANVSPQSGLFLGPERRGKVVARAESDGNSRVGETAGDGNDDSLVRVSSPPDWIEKTPPRLFADASHTRFVSFRSDRARARR